LWEDLKRGLKKGGVPPNPGKFFSNEGDYNVWFLREGRVTQRRKNLSSGNINPQEYPYSRVFPQEMLKGKSLPGPKCRALLKGWKPRGKKVGQFRAKIKKEGCKKRANNSRRNNGFCVNVDPGKIPALFLPGKYYPGPHWGTTCVWGKFKIKFPRN